MSETTSTSTTDTMGLAQDVYDRVAAFQDEDYPGDEAFQSEDAGGDLTLTRGQAFQIRSALHAAVGEILQALQMESWLGGVDEENAAKATTALTQFLDLNDRLLTITEPEPAVA